MLLYWVLSRFRFPAAVDIAIDDGLHWLGTSMSKPIRNTSFEHWLLNREGQTTTLVAVTMLVALLGIVALHISSRRRPIASVTTVRSPGGQEQIVTEDDPQAFVTAQYEADQDASSPSASSAPSQIEAAASPPTDTSLFSNKFATSGLRPLNADRTNSPLRFAAPKGHKMPASLVQPAPAETPRTPPSSALKEGLLMKLQATHASSGPTETPVSSSSGGDGPVTPIRENVPVIPSSDDGYRAWLMSTTFSHIKEKWPTSFEVSVKSGDLLEDGTPTKKFVDRMVLKKAEDKSPSSAA